ncbi:hypothetical protein TNCV_3828431 [Trichonephila clavipes]|nr:hypothetical protein TNCV_3828431 [Trichonephila clavipes]
MESSWEMGGSAIQRKGAKRRIDGIPMVSMEESCKESCTEDSVHVQKSTKSAYTQCQNSKLAPMLQGSCSFAAPDKNGKRHPSLQSK